MNFIALITITILSIVVLILLVQLRSLYVRHRKQHEFTSPNDVIHGNNSQPIFLLIFLGAFLLCVIFSTLYYRKFFLPYPSAKPSTDVVALFNATTIITGIAFFTTQILLFYFAWRFQKRKNQTASFIKGSNKLELVWTVIPTLAFIFLFIWGHILWTKIITPPEGDVLVIEVMAEQFNWKVRYAGADKKMGRTSFRFISTSNAMGVDTSDPASNDDFIPLQMHVPKNKPVRLILRSKDVIHSFYIPLFRTKMDAVPGMSTSIHFTPIETTAEMRLKRNDPGFEYEVACAELCGRMHFAMKMILVVDEPAQFNIWYANQKSWTATNDDQVKPNNQTTKQPSDQVTK